MKSLQKKSSLKNLPHSLGGGGSAGNSFFYILILFLTARGRPSIGGGEVLTRKEIQMEDKELDWKRLVLDDEALRKAVETLLEIARTIDTRGKMKGLSWVKKVPLEGANFNEEESK